ncbi:MAG: hypothetical protein ACOC80_07135 [Petrotogales bacterium]
MKSIIFPFLLVLLLLIPIGSSLNVYPEDFSTFEKKDGYEVVDFSLVNEKNSTENVTISIEENISQYLSFSTYNFSISSNDIKTVYAIILRDEPFKGKIFFNNESVSIAVNPIKVNNETDSIKIIPSSPKGGKNIIVSHGQTNQTGYLVCHDTNNVYLVKMEEGLALVSLNEDEYGNSTIFLGNTSFNFNIKSKYSGKLSIISDYDVEIDKNIDVKVFSSGEPVNVELKFISPDNDTYLRNTNNQGETSFKPNKVGKWTIKAFFYENTVETNFIVKPKPLSISIEQIILSGTETTINVGQKAEVSIKKDEATWSYTSDDSGKVSFTPPFGGKYNVVAKTENQEGSTNFVAKIKTDIIVKNEEGKKVDKIVPGNTYLIQVIDSNNVPISEADSVKIRLNDNPHDTLELSGGSTIWKAVENYGSYLFRFEAENSNVLLQSDLNISSSNIKKNIYDFPVTTEETDYNVYIWLVIPVLIIISLAVILFLDKKGIIDIKKYNILDKIIRKSKIPDDLI